MKKSFWFYWILSLIGVTAASYYPIQMGITVVSDIIKDGSVMAENYPKYIIPYTPISIAVIIGVLLMPVILGLARRFELLQGSVLALGTFMFAEFVFENMVIVTETVETKLESWQMYMCSIVALPQIETKKTAVEMLMGNYSPTFKIHFYIISAVLILAILNCIYGFGKVIRDGDGRRVKPLVMQSIAAVLFLGMCILACFTAFGRDGSIQVSATTAALMSGFFILFGVTMGMFTGSHLYGRRKALSVAVPAVVSSSVTLVMYIGEMFLLSGNLYRFGSGAFFDGMGVLVFAPVDVAVIVVSGALTAAVMLLLGIKKAET